MEIEPVTDSRIPIIIDGPAIRIRGARQNNLKNIDIDIPRDKPPIKLGRGGERREQSRKTVL
jgi:hypothetical protein